MPQLDFRAPPPVHRWPPLSAGATVGLDRNQSNYLGNVLRLAAGRNRAGVQRARRRMAGSDCRAQAGPTISPMAWPATRPQDNPPNVAYVFCAAQARKARLHGAEGRSRWGRPSLRPGHHPLHPGLSPRQQRAEMARPMSSKPPSKCGNPQPLPRSPSPLRSTRLSRPSGEAQRLLVFCDEAADVADPLQALKSSQKASKRDRCPDSARRAVSRRREARR